MTSENMISRKKSNITFIILLSIFAVISFLNYFDHSINPQDTTVFAFSYKYGFILRYPLGKQEITGTSYEPWHYRYVGEEAALEIYEQGICLEEYFE